MALPGERARRGLPRPARVLLDVGGMSIGLVLAAVAALRRGKAVHPQGVVHDARLVVSGGPAAPSAATLLATPGEHPAVVRFSRSLGLPRPLVDLLGMSIRLSDVYGPGRHQDFLLVTSADLPVVHHVFLPASDVQQRPYTSSLPYRAGNRLFVVGALPRPASPRPGGRDEFERLSAAAATGRLSFDLAVAAPLGRFRPVADLRIGARLPDELDALRFDPWNTGGGLRPAGTLNRLRDYAYPLSQAAWRRTRRAGAELQDVAERELGASGRPAAAGEGGSDRGLAR